MEFIIFSFSAKSSSSSASDSESDARSDTSKKKSPPLRKGSKSDIETKKPEPKKPEPKKDVRKSTDSAGSGTKRDVYSEPEEGKSLLFILP